HSSHAREAESRNGGEPNLVSDNEQLEFLGDAVLGFVTSRELFQRFPQFSEGKLSKLRAYLVSEKHLIRAAKQLQIGRYLRLGRGEDKSGGRSKTALLVDALEAVVAAMYLDAGLEKTRALILSEILEPELERMAEGSGDLMSVNDFKSALQETAHSMGWSQPCYVLVKERGPEHQKTFTVEARVRTHGQHEEPEYAARGEGLTKKQAEQGAARKALEYLRSLDNPNPKPAGSRNRQAQP
ncbi:MAG: ribonuclease III, partial [Acidobacteriia bacterium]|nr:ribonuclease III [Terriglobia bacterium]